jgi:hypothetical protein
MHSGGEFSADIAASAVDVIEAKYWFREDMVVAD